VSDKDDPFGSTPPEDPFGRKDEPPSLQDIWAKAGQGQSEPARPPPSAYPPPSGASPPPSDEAWRADPQISRDPFGAPSPSGPARRADGAIPALVLGILGLVLCPLCAPFAWALGRKAEQQVDASGGMLTGRGEATAGKILGIIATVLVILGILFFVLIAVGTSTGP